MNNRKPTPHVPQPIRKTCPICGDSSYSAGGIHPQCAVTQADAPRQAQLNAAKKVMAIEKNQAAKE